MEATGAGYFVYILRCTDNTLYTGTARDVDKRLAQHNLGQGARYTKGRVPAVVVYREPCRDKPTALRRELSIKRLTRREKERLLVLPQPAVTGKMLDLADFRAMEALERRCYGRDCITPAAEAYRWYGAYPDSTVAAFAGGTLAGFVNLFPVTEQVFSQLLDGTFNDRDLAVSDMVDLEQTAGPLFLFLSCIAIDKLFRGGDLTRRLLSAAAARYAPYRGRVASVIADNVTQKGARLSERLGMARVTKTDHGSVVYLGGPAVWKALISEK